MRVFDVPEPSRRKALAVMDAEKKGSPMTIKRHFDHFLPVVHLWGANYIKKQDYGDTEAAFFGSTPEEGRTRLTELLSLAAALRHFGETTIQPRSKSPLIEPGIMYAIPNMYLRPDGKVKIWFGDDVGETLREHLKDYANRLLP